MDCKYFDGCSAPMCPKHKEAEETQWFPNEDVCCLRDAPAWVKRQRKISKKAKDKDALFFTFLMLNRDCRISKGIKGIDPDGTKKERDAAEKAWLKRHPAITEGEREKMREKGKINKEVLSLYRAKKKAY